MLLEGKTAIVTGSSQGIGRDIALLLAQEGANVVINGMTPELVDRVVEEVSTAGGQAVGLAGSVAESETVESLVGRCLDAFGGIDILVNNAGVPAAENVEDCSPEQWRGVMDTNLTSAYLCSHYVVPQMKAQNWGRILFSSSLAATGFMGGSVYAASKAGMIGLCLAMARELDEHGITANILCPSARTPKMQEAEDKYGYLTNITNQMFDRGWISKKQLDRILGMAGPDGIAPLAVYLCLEEAGSISGQTFDVEGHYIERMSHFVVAAGLEHDYDNLGPIRLAELRKSLPELFSDKK